MLDFCTSDDKFNTITICWKYTAICNMNCSYCTLLNNKTNKTHTKNNKILYSKLKRESEKNKDILYLVDIEGGEPTLDKTVFDLKSTDNLKFTLFTNFKDPDIEKLSKFSVSSKIILSMHSTVYSTDINKYLMNLEKLSKTANVQNISVSILVSNNLELNPEKINNLNKIIEKIKDMQIKDSYISLAENFETVKIENKNDSLVKACRLKYSFYGYKCFCNFINLTCENLNFHNCSLNIDESFIKLNTKNYLKRYFICKNKICNIHDNQLSYKKIK